MRNYLQPNPLTMQPVSLPQRVGMLFRSIHSLLLIYSIVNSFLWIIGIIMTDTYHPLTLKQLIAKSNITQRDLAKRTGISERAINEWVAGKYIPRLDNAIVVSRELGVSLKTLALSLGLDITGIPDDSPN